MTNYVRSPICAAIALLLGLGCTAASGQGTGKRTTLVGQVIDSACLYTKGLKKPISRACALECAAGGSPLVILGNDGKVYLPIDSKMPAQGQNFRLVKFGGETVKLTGQVYERNGSHAIVIETIEKSTATAN